MEIQKSNHFILQQSWKKKINAIYFFNTFSSSFGLMCLNNYKYNFDMQGFSSNLYFGTTKERWGQDFSGFVYFLDNSGWQTASPVYMNFSLLAAKILLIVSYPFHTRPLSSLWYVLNLHLLSFSAPGLHKQNKNKAAGPYLFLWNHDYHFRALSSRLPSGQCYLLVFLAPFTKEEKSDNDDSLTM